MNTSQKKSLTIFNQALAGELMIKGFKLQGLSPDRKYPDRNVYFFQNCEEIKDAIEEFKIKKNI